MHTYATTENDEALKALIEASKVEPIAVVSEGETVAYVVSRDDYERLNEQQRIRRVAKLRLKQTITELQREATRNGMTGDIAERLLADES